MEDVLHPYTALLWSSKPGATWVLSQLCQGKKEQYWYSLVKYFFIEIGISVGNRKS